MNNILINNEPITQEQLEAIETKETFKSIEAPFEKNISLDKYTTNLQDVKKNSSNIPSSEIDRLENIDFEIDNVYDISMGYSMSLNDFLQDEDNFYPTTGNSSPISRKVLFVYKKAKEISFSAIEKTQLLEYLKTDMRRNHIFFPCTPRSTQYNPVANFNDTFYIKLDIPTPFYFEIHDFINMMTSNEGVFYITPKLDMNGNHQDVRRTISWGVSMEKGDPLGMVSAKHCQKGSDIKIYTYELCSHSNFPELCEVSNRIKTKNNSAKLEIINLLLTDEIYARYLIEHENSKTQKIQNYENQNLYLIKDLRKYYPVSKFDKFNIRIFLNALNKYYKKIEHSIKSYELRKENRLNDQLNTALPYYTAKYILDQRKDEKNVSVIEARNVARQYLKEMQEKYISDNDDLTFLNYYKNRFKDIIQVFQEYQQDPNLLEVNNNRIQFPEFMRILFITGKEDGKKIDQIYSYLDKIEEYEQIDKITRLKRNVIYNNDGQFEKIKLFFLHKDKLSYVLEDMKRQIPRNNQYQTPQNNQYQTPQNNQYQTPQNNQYQTPQNNQYQTPQNDQYQTPQNDQTIFHENIFVPDVDENEFDEDESNEDEPNEPNEENNDYDGVAVVLNFDEDD